MKGMPTIVGRAIYALSSTVALSATSTYAHSPVSREEASELRQLVKRSNLIFQGRVVKVEYRNSEATDDEPELPHAFVTYRMSNVLHGEKAEDVLTIRFLGGPDGRGDFLEVSGIPMFQVGEENILFLKTNGEDGCPLVYCEWGRFRVHKGGVYNTHGSPVRAIIEDNAIARGEPLEIFRTLNFPAPTFDGLMENPEVQQMFKEMEISKDEARRQYEAEAPKTLQLVKELPPRDPSQKPDLTEKNTERPTIKRPNRLQQKRGELKPPIKESIRTVDGKLSDNAGVVRQSIQDRTVRATTVAPLAIARGEREIPEGPIAVEQFTENLKRIVSEVNAPVSALKSINTEGPFKANAFKITKAPLQRNLKMPGATKPSKEDLKELREHPSRENEAGGQEQ